MINIDLPDFPELEDIEISIPKDSTNLKIASDSSFNSTTTSFSPGQTIFIKVDAQNDGQTSKTLNLRDNNYNIVATYSLQGSGTTFTTNLQAPSKSGSYSLEANISSQGSVTNIVKTITIGNGSTSSSVNIQSNIQTENGNQVSPSPESNNESPQTQSPDEMVKGIQESKRDLLGSLWSNFIKIFTIFDVWKV